LLGRCRTGRKRRQFGREGDALAVETRVEGAAVELHPQALAGPLTVPAAAQPCPAP
jgi:hypothetical protein